MKKLTVFCAAACLAASAAAQNHPDLHEVLDRQKGRNLIEIPKGTYTLDVRSNGPYKFHNLTDVHINGNGSTVICNNQEQAFSFYNCVRVELRDLTIDYDKHHVLMRGEDVHLTLNEFKIVALLGKYAGKVLTYDFLIREIWGPKAKADNQILRVNMANIRRKIEKNPAAPEYIFTEIGVGYRMLENE